MQTRSVTLPAVFGLGLLGFLLHAKAASAQTAPAPLSLHECMELALASHTSVVVARTQADIASLGVSQAKAALRPQARLAGAFTYNTPWRRTPPSRATWP